MTFVSFATFSIILSTLAASLPAESPADVFADESSTTCGHTCIQAADFGSQLDQEHNLSVVGASTTGHVSPSVDAFDALQSGWQSSYAGSVACEVPDSVCTIDRRSADNITQAEFERVYKNKRPLIIVGGSRNMHRRPLFTRQHLLKHYGDLVFPVGTSATLYNGKGQKRAFRMALSTYLRMLEQPYRQDDDQLYLFEWAPNLADEAAALLGPFDALPLFDFGHRPHERIIAIGKTDAGIPYHFHGQAWNELLFGRKRWFLYPANSPPAGGYSDYRGQDSWVRDNYPKIKEAGHMPHECFQLPGDVFYVPEGWYHATVNCGQTVAVASQVQSNDQLQSTSDMQLFSSAMELLGKDEERAVELLESYLERVPNNDLALFHLGRMYGAMKLYDEARDMLRRATRANPMRVDAWVYLAIASLELGKPNIAMQHIEKAIELKPPKGAESWSFIYRVQEAIFRLRGQAELARQAADNHQRSRRDTEVYRQVQTID
eukprot:TRINITY_DN11583_c0_g1_i1.p1 TRINITY_DN11583_c0_g1~~TRINITY_DN11583_c0_g1_i1.p1  ORF type:complete len:490 (-),score=157.25 TRINITY_DN11583_c0_g1_i1:55-1524(-)